MLAKKHVSQTFVPGDHAATFGGNPLAAAAGLAATSVLLDPDFLKTVVEKGQYFREKLCGLKTEHPQITKVKGLGLMIGCDLSVDPQAIVEKCLEKGVLINAVGGKVLRFVPPLTVTKEEIDQVIEVLSEVL